MAVKTGKIMDMVAVEIYCFDCKLAVRKPVGTYNSTCEACGSEWTTVTPIRETHSTACGKDLTERELRSIWNYHMHCYHLYGEGKSAIAIRHYGDASRAAIELEERFSIEV